MKPTLFWGRCAALLAAFFLIASTVSAQGFKWWSDDTYRRELGLTQEQSKRLEDIFQMSLPMLKAQKKALDTAETDFERLVERGDDSAVMEQVSRVELARAELNKTRTLMLLKMRRALTTDQWIKLGALHQADEKAKKSAHGTSTSSK
jgi:Spy/CpxP family protein refolding chaperone